MFPMLVSHSIVLGCFCFETRRIHYDRSSFFNISVFSVFLWCIARGAKLSFACNKILFYILWFNVYFCVLFLAY